MLGEHMDGVGDTLGHDPCHGNACTGCGEKEDQQHIKHIKIIFPIKIGRIQTADAQIEAGYRKRKDPVGCAPVSDPGAGGSEEKSGIAIL